MKIHAPSRQEEKQALLSVLGSLDGDFRNGWKDRLKREFATLFVTSVLICVIIIIQGTALRFTLTVAVLGFVAGVVAGVLAYRLQSAKVWPTIAKCVDREKVESRLRELDA